MADVPEEVRSRLEHAAGLYEEAAAELERAAGHCRRAAEHFRNRDVPRGTAHSWAAFGHVREAQDKLEEQAQQHRLQARL